MRKRQNVESGIQWKVYQICEPPLPRKHPGCTAPCLSRHRCYTSPAFPLYTKASTAVLSRAHESSQGNGIVDSPNLSRRTTCLQKMNPSHTAHVLSNRCNPWPGGPNLAARPHNYQRGVPIHFFACPARVSRPSRIFHWPGAPGPARATTPPH